MRAHVVGCVLVVPLLASAAGAAGSFQGLGKPPSTLSILRLGVARDGSAVIAVSEGAVDSYPATDLWTAASGWAPLGASSQGFLFSANQLSDDGDVIAGFGDGELGPPFPVLIAPPGRGPLVTLHSPSECGPGESGPGAGASLGGLSADGDIAAGTLVCEGTPATVPSSEATRFLPSGSERLGTLPGDDSSAAASVSADGSALLGTSTGPGGTRAFRWTVGAGMLALPAPLGAGNLLFSRDGSTAAGFRNLPGLSHLAALWSEAEGLVWIGDLPGGEDRTALAGLSDDGRVSFGTGGSAQGEEAIRFTRTGGLEGLGDLPGGSFRSEALASTPDGTRIFGRGASAENPSEAFVWSEFAGMRKVKDVLLGYGLPVQGWNLQDVQGVTADGRTWVGRGIAPDGGEQVWMATIPAGIGTLHRLPAPDVAGAATAAALSGDGQVVVGSGDCAGGGRCVLRWRAAPAGWPATAAPESWPAAGEPVALGSGLPMGLSRDGGVAVGNRGDAVAATRGFRLLATGGALEELPLAADCTSRLSAVAWTGSVAVGWNDACTGSAPLGGFLWSETGGLALGPGSYPTSVSADGRVVAGVRGIGLPPSTAPSIVYGWSERSGYRDLAIAPPGAYERVRVSADASTFVGVGISGSGSELFRFTEAEGIRFLGALPAGAAPTGPRALSIDGSVIAGDRATPTGSEAFVWTEATGLVGLGVLPGDVSSTADVVSFTGRLVFGRSRSAGGASKAIVWDAEGGLRSLEQALAQELGLDVEGWSLESVAGISDDGLTITGTGMAPDGTRRGWLLTLP